MERRTIVLAALMAALVGCGASEGPVDGGDATRDAAAIDASVDDAGRLDASAFDASTLDASAFDASTFDASAFDASTFDASTFDASTPGDAGLRDAGPPDGGARDAGARDSGPPDAGTRDAGPPDAGVPPGLSTPCANGPGWSLFRFRYSGGSTSPRVDVWDATCSYSLAPGSACNVVNVGSVASVMEGTAVLLDGSDYIRVRFSVTGLSFTRAAVYVQGRSYATSSSTDIRVWSPLYGERIMGPVDNDWTYDWYGMDWSDKLYPTDSPSLTAIQIYPYRGSGSLAVRAVELCVQ